MLLSGEISLIEVTFGKVDFQNASIEIEKFKCY